MYALRASDRAAAAGAVPSLLPVLAPVRRRAPARTTPSAPRTPASSLPDVRPARAVAPPRAVQCLLPVLAPHRARAPASPLAACAGDSAPLRDLRAVDANLDPRLVPRLL